MNKQEFLQILGERLSEELPRQAVLSNLQYYESYINGALKAGKTEQQVFDELGDPYLIAHTIIDAQTQQNVYTDRYAQEADYTEVTPEESATTKEDQENTTYTEYTTQEETVYTAQPETSDSWQEESTQETQNYGRSFQVGQHGCLIAVIVAVLVLFLVIRLVGSVISFIWPVLGPVLIVLFIVALFKDKNR